MKPNKQPGRLCQSCWLGNNHLMTGSIELDPDGQNLQIRFPYRPDLVDEVKTIPGRRWDRNGKLWRVPATQIGNVVDIFMRHGFAMAPEVTSLLAGTKGETVVELPTVVVEPPDTISIGMLNERVRSVLRDSFAAPVWVHGEILDYDKNKDRPNVFFTLVDKLEGSDAVAAQATVVLFKDTARMLSTKLENAPEPLTLSDGIEIRALVRSFGTRYS